MGSSGKDKEMQSDCAGSGATGSSTVGQSAQLRPLLIKESGEGGREGGREGG